MTNYCVRLTALFLSNFVVSASKLASFAGQVISTSPVLGNCSRIMTMHYIMSTM